MTAVKLNQDVPMHPDIIEHPVIVPGAYQARYWVPSGVLDWFVQSVFDTCWLATLQESISGVHFFCLVLKSEKQAGVKKNNVPQILLNFRPCGAKFLKK